MENAPTCSVPETSCVHHLTTTNGTLSNTATTLLTVSLSVEDMQPANGEGRHLNEDEIARQADALSSRLKIAEFIVKTLTERTEELQTVLNTLKQSNSSSETESGSEQPATPPEEVESSLPENRQSDSASRPTMPLLQRRHTTTSATLNLNLKDRPAVGWEERAAAFMLRRRSLKAAMEQQALTPALRSNLFDGSHSPRSPDVRLPLSRSSSGHSPSTPGFGYEQDFAWDYEKRRQTPRRGALIAAAWTTYQDAWNELNARVGVNGVRPYLTFATIPWPVFRSSGDPPFREPGEITLEEVRDFVLSPFHSLEKSKETRILESSVLWNPDKFGLWLSFVVLSERAKVKEGMEKVYWCLNHLK